MIFFFAFLPSAQAESRGDWEQCRHATHEVESRYRMPKGILSAISMVETGRRAPGGKREAWPWTVNANGQSYYFTDKSKAIKAVRQLLAQGKRSIDVGCMQINLRYHPRAFTSLEEAFDPVANTTYGAFFLNQLNRNARSWQKAVGRYHSFSPHLKKRYLTKVNKVWNTERRRKPVRHKPVQRATRTANSLSPALPPTVSLPAVPSLADKSLHQKKSGPEIMALSPLNPFPATRQEGHKATADITVLRTSLAQSEFRSLTKQADKTVRLVMHSISRAEKKETVKTAAHSDAGYR